MPWAADTRFAKTAKGIVEIRDRLQGIGPRARQVLILVNGRRSVAELGELIPEPALTPHLRMLEANGFIALVPDGRAPDTAFGPQTVTGPATLVRELWSDTRVRASVDEPDATMAPRAATPRYDPLLALRGRVIRNLLDTVGPAGDLMADRIARCATLQELRDLMPAVSSIVEALRGPSAAREFVIRATKMR